MVCNRKYEKPAGLNSCVDSLMINRSVLVLTVANRPPDFWPSVHSDQSQSLRNEASLNSNAVFVRNSVTT